MRMAGEGDGGGGGDTVMPPATRTRTASWIPTITTTASGLWAIKWSFVALFVTALLQLAVVILSNSIALLADTIHNFADAATAIPLGIAFLFARRPRAGALRTVRSHRGPRRPRRGPDFPRAPRWQPTRRSTASFIPSR